jgi:hypothetical protein
MARRKDFQAEHHELQRVLARELAEYGPQPLNGKDADMVAWHLADVPWRLSSRPCERRRHQTRHRRSGMSGGIPRAVDNAVTQPSLRLPP